MNPVELILNKTKKIIKLEGLAGTSKWLTIAKLHESSNKPVFIIAEQSNVETIYSDCKFFLDKFASNKDSHHNVCIYPSWEVLPFEPLSPHPDITGDRLKVLHRLEKGENLIVVASIESIMQKVIPKKILAQKILKLETGDSLERELITEYLVQAGYEHSEMIAYKGEFSVRGDILDVFPSTTSNPIRIEFFGDDIESIKEFSIINQRSVKVVESVTILPARELIAEKNTIATALDKLKTKAESIDNKSETSFVIDAFSNGMVFNGMERFTPFFYEMSTVFDYITSDSTIVFNNRDVTEKVCIEFSTIIQKEYQRSIDRDEICPEPETLYLDEKELSSAIDRYKRIELSDLKFSGSSQNLVQVETRSVNIFNHTFHKFIEKSKEWLAKSYPVFLVVQTDGQAQRLNEILTENEVGAKILQKGAVVDISPFEAHQDESDTKIITIIIGKLSSGFYLCSSNIIVVTEEELYGPKKKTRIRKKTVKDKFLSGVDQIKSGDFVVHLEYGVGRYVGTKFIALNDKEEEFFHIEYANDEKVYLPMEGISFLQKYKGVDEISPQLAKLGTLAWKKTKAKATKEVELIAEDLLKLYASRKIAEGFAFSPSSTWHKEFADSFEFDETEDQFRAIEDVAKDMESPELMDRLVCGDVGYGKTEVAMRAAFKAVFDKKQVAILAPTTLLVNQHYKNFVQRFAAFPVNIDMLCRFRNPKEQKEIVKKLNIGQLDIIIGTHRIFQKDIAFQNLGLIIIDEEQRFGVSHKEKLKKLRTSADVLTLSATPIPRTLHLSLVGIRDMSIIATPPHNRQSIKTYIRKFDDNVIREAIVREMERNGQVFFIHNRVDNIEMVAKLVKELVPKASIGIGHGQMGEKALEKVMTDFVEKRIDVLVCTTIVESGLDIPAANTIIINKAQNFGLSQLHQLRGRVGRDKHRAYAYLLVPDEIIMSKSARARLEAIEDMGDLGAGLQLATRDLEIRGSGNILGHSQSGNVASVGFYMYCDIMEETIKKLKGDIQEKKVDTTINIGVKGSIGKDYISSLHQRLEIYKRLYTLKDSEELEDLTDEIVDRYGPMTTSVNNLIGIIDLKMLAGELMILRISMDKDGAVLVFDPETPLKPEQVFEIMKEIKSVRFAASDVIQILFQEKDFDNRIDAIKSTLELLIRSYDEDR